MTEADDEFKCDGGGACTGIPPRQLPVSNSNPWHYCSVLSECFYCVSRSFSCCHGKVIMSPLAK